jgi:hypothetical protein
MRTHIAAALALVVAGCAGHPPQGAPVAGQSGPVIVTCLVPGQIRQLDNNTTYLTAPRPMKLTARDCENRGGTIEKS